MRIRELGINCDSNWTGIGILYVNCHLSTNKGTNMRGIGQFWVKGIFRESSQVLKFWKIAQNYKYRLAARGWSTQGQWYCVAMMASIGLGSVILLIGSGRLCLVISWSN